ncbi:hypothetical protein TM239_37670 [Bradyrhizobium sp. TM239]|nr:hypothetical protein TM233_10000 [Bradyrhizobium sp. TM233]GMP04211.1 hypothetical protein TM239_37670 [Bradyrhizobium sp. TM239]
MPGAETLSSFAAPPMVPVTITARITSTWRSVIMLLAPERGSWRRSSHESRDGIQRQVGDDVDGSGKPLSCPGRAATRLALRRRAGTQEAGGFVADGWALALRRIVEERLRCVRGARAGFINLLHEKGAELRCQTVSTRIRAFG